MKPRHCIFVCVNERDGADPKGSCHAKFAPLVLQKFRAELDKRNIPTAEVKLIPSGCLGPCSEGVSVSIQPDNVWYGKVRALDVAEILDKHILGGEKVTRLELPDEALD
jgi:(2Fe-2S) ferredoxin